MTICILLRLFAGTWWVNPICNKGCMQYEKNMVTVTDQTLDKKPYCSCAGLLYQYQSMGRGNFDETA